MAIDISAEQDAIGVAVGTITGINVHDFVPGQVHPPVAIVALPDVVEYDHTMARGKDRAVYPVYVLVGKASDASARDKLAGYMSGTGASTASVKAAVDSGGLRRVTGAQTQIMTFAGIDYLAAVFDVEVTT